MIAVQTEVAKLGLALNGVMSLVADRVMRITPATGAVVEIAEGEEMVYRAAAGAAEGTLGLRLNDCWRQPIRRCTLPKRSGKATR